MQTTHQLIDAKYEIKKYVEPDGYLLDIKETNHPVEGRSIQFELSQAVKSHFDFISEVCKKHDLNYYVTAKESTVIVTIY